MIHFVCICGEPFDVPAELAGDQLQCPACLRLVDVPLLSQQASFEDDGTIRLQEAEETPSDLAEKLRVFGHDEDLRQNYDEFIIAGDKPADEPAPRPAPRYDPITGELMLPLGIQNDDEIKAARPVIDTSSPVLGYAQTAVPKGQFVAASQVSDIGWWSAPWRIVSGMSLVAVAVIFTLHAVVVLGLSLPGFNVFFMLPALVLVVTIAAHYANTMEDLGPNLRDRVPVLLRNVSFSEDIAGPLFNVLSAFLFSFGPLILAAMFTPAGTFYKYPWVWLAGLGWGFLVFPLAVFTTVCGGVVQNLTPKRMTSVLTAAPLRVTMATATFWLASMVYAVAFASTGFPDLQALTQATPITHAQVVAFTVERALTLGVFALAVYLMHLAAFWFGLVHRAKHDDFDWVLQRHDRTYRNDTIVQLMRNRPRHLPPNAGRGRMQAVAGDAPKPVLPITGPRHEGFEVKF